jgi:Ca-activated chloride channel family protein
VIMRISSPKRKATVFALMTAFLLAPGGSADAKGKGFKDVVKHLETNYRAKKTKIPMLGLANFAVKLIRPAGVKGFKLAVFSNQDFSSRPELSNSFNAVMREAYDKKWSPLVQLSSKRTGNNRVFIYAKYSGKDVEFAVASFDQREAVVVQVKFNPDAAARFLENPKIMGISVGGPIRGNAGAVAARNAKRGPRPATGAGNTGPIISSGDRTIAEMEAAANGEPQPTTATPPSNGAAVNPEHKTAATAVPAPPVTATPAGSTKAEATVASTSASPAAATPSETIAPDPLAPDKDAIRIETRLVNLNVKAMSRAGQPITDLKLNDFVVFEDGVQQKVEHFKPVNAPVNAVLLIDLSGSTRRKRDAMITAAKRFVDALPAGDKLSIVAFTRRYRALTGFTSDKTALKTAVEKIKDIDGGTAFYDSMWKALDDLDRVPDARKSIVVLTDGEDESLIGDEETNRSFEDLINRASEEDVTIYPIYFKAAQHYDKVGLIFGGGGSLLGNEKEKTARRQLDELAEATGGEVVNAQREEDLDGAYERVARELHTLYSLGYLPDKLKHDGGFRKIQVKISRDDSVARTRRGYYDR